MSVIFTKQILIAKGKNFLAKCLQEQKALMNSNSFYKIKPSFPFLDLL